MWKKDEGTPGELPQTRTPPPQGAPSASPPSSERASIGRSITIQGEVSGDEDLLIQGRVEGSVSLELHAVTVGREGQVKADITGRVITIEGEVEGNLHAHEQIILRSSARVDGDIKAPRVVLDDGANFRGLVDMGPPPAPEAPKKAASAKGAVAKSGPNGSPRVESDKEGSTPPGGGGSASSGAEKKAPGTVGKATH